MSICASSAAEVAWRSARSQALSQTKSGSITSHLVEADSGHDDAVSPWLPAEQAGARGPARGTISRVARVPVFLAVICSCPNKNSISSVPPLGSGLLSHQLDTGAVWLGAPGPLKKSPPKL